MLWVSALILVVQVIVGVGLFYRYFLLVVGSRPRARAVGTASSDLRFAVAVPAHNEESVIDATVAHLRQMSYPPEQFDIHVVADHCSDATAQEARSAGAIVHERTEGPRGRKGYALAWLLKRLIDDRRHYDALVVFDADSQVAPDFLGLMNQVMATGAQVAQGRHVIANPDASVFSALADADMRLNNRIRNQAKENLGLSARLMGDGMCFRREILATHPYEAYSLTEDREYGLQLVTHGVRVHFVPEAISEGQAAARWSDATGQRLRWYGGAFDLQRRYLVPLLAAAWRHCSLDALDHALELILPPFSVQCALAVALVVFQVLLLATRVPSTPNSSLVLTGFALAYPFLGLLAERAPWKSFRALVYGPIYTFWRVWVGLRVRFRQGRVPWIRTPRAGEGQRSR